MPEYNSVFRIPGFMSSSEFDSKREALEIPNFKQIFQTDIECPEITKGTTDPTTSTAASKVGNFYMNTSTGKMWKCTVITTSGSTTTYTWKKVEDADDVDSDITDKALRIDGTSQTVSAANQQIARNIIGAIGLTEYDATVTDPDEGMLYYVTE